MSGGDIIYDGVVSGGAIAAAVSAIEGEALHFIPYANGMRILIVESAHT